MAHMRLWGGRPWPGGRHHDWLPGRHATGGAVPATGRLPPARRRTRRARLLCLGMTAAILTCTLILAAVRGPAADAGVRTSTSTTTTTTPADTAPLAAGPLPPPNAHAPARFHGVHVSPDALVGMTVRLRERARAGLATTLHPLGPGLPASSSTTAPTTASSAPAIPVTAAAATAPPSLTLFACPKPGGMAAGSPNHAALQSWLRLRPTVQVVLFGSATDETLQAVVAASDGRVSVESQYDTTFRGVPLFNSLIARAQRAPTDVAMFINADIVLLNDLWPALRRAHRDGPGWLVTGMRIDVDDLPFDFVSGDGGADFDDRVRAHARATGRLHSYGGVDYWAWDTGGQKTPGTPLINGTLPSFVYGRGKYDNWFTHAAIQGGHRRVVDASNVVTAIHVNHKYAHVAGVDGGGSAVAAAAAVDARGDTKASLAAAGGTAVTATTTPTTPKPIIWSARSTKQSAFEVFSNIHLATAAPGGYRNQMGTAHHAPRTLVACEEPAVAGVCMVARARPGTCPCEYSPLHTATMTDAVADRDNRLVCGGVSEEPASDYAIPTVPTPSAAPGLPHTLDQLLPHVVDERGIVILTGTTFKYHTMLMNFACNLRGLGIRNPLIAAFDEATYRYAFVRGLAVYPVTAVTAKTAGDTSTASAAAAGGGVALGPRHGGSSSSSMAANPGALTTTTTTTSTTHDCDYGTDCFRQVTKLKSRVVLDILRKGYHVLWSDMDVVWLRNPVPDLWAYGPGTLAIQSNSPGVGETANALRRINSGFYLARSDADTINAFKMIIRHAMASDTTEQPSFYAVLCGEDGQHRVGDTACTEPLTGLHTVLLPLAKYPNGAHGGWWDRPADLRSSGVIALHNNWITGLDHKFDRLHQHGMMYVGDDDAMSCRYGWVNATVPAAASGVAT